MTNDPKHPLTQFVRMPVRDEPARKRATENAPPVTPTPAQPHSTAPAPQSQPAQPQTMGSWTRRMKLGTRPFKQSTLQDTNTQSRRAYASWYAWAMLIVLFILFAGSAGLVLLLLNF